LFSLLREQAKSIPKLLFFAQVFLERTFLKIRCSVMNAMIHTTFNKITAAIAHCRKPAKKIPDVYWYSQEILQSTQ
jgi:hypothetical protein